MEPDELIEELVASTLRGRGGAGFPTGRKASLVDRSGAGRSYLVVNADESEPGAFKDREIMRRDPHRLIEGCLIAAHAILSKHVFIYIRGEYLTEYEILAARGRRGAGSRAVRRRRHRRAPRRRRLHLRRGDRAARLAGGQARPAAHAAAVPADRRGSTCRRRRSTTSDDRDGRRDHRDGCRGVPEDRRRRTLRAPRSSRSPATS